MGRRTTTRIAVALVAGLAATGVMGQAIYRCGDSYSQQACEGGRALPEASPSPSAVERAKAQAASQRDAALADRMEKERLRQEAQGPSAYIPPPKAELAHEPHKWPEKAATRKLDVFTASAPGGKPRKEAKAKPEKKKADKPADKPGGAKTTVAAANKGAAGKSAGAPKQR